MKQSLKLICLVTGGAVAGSGGGWKGAIIGAIGGVIQGC